MTESDSPHSPVDAALDLFVYAPVGLALTAAEELPKLAAKGRARLGQHLTMARMVGQFAVTQGRQQIERRMAPPAPPASPPQAAPEIPDAEQAMVDVTYDDLLAREGDGSSEPATSAEAPEKEASGWPMASPNGAPSVGSLAIPGYDSLAASQVVQRLAGLSREELDAVGAYESTHRNRRTILTRVRQLQAG